MIEILLIREGFAVKATGYFFLMLMVMMGCSEKMNMEYVDKDNDIKMIKAEAIEAFKRKKIFFGHASVGSNIIDGIEDIRANNQHVQNINIQDLKEDNEVNEPAIYHAKNGKNGFPKSKVDAFKKTLEEKGLGNKLDIAFFKFCYVDIEKDSNVQEMFDYYTSNMEYLKKKFPRLQFVHVTTPLYSHSRGIKGFIKNIIRGDVSNVKRNEFNKMLVKKYQGVDPIYDLASIESQLPDGKRSSFNYKGEIYLSLAPEYTYDGGHLNETGRYLAAKELLKILAELSNK